MRIAEEIKDRVTIRDVLIRYGYNEGRRGRAPCPLHHGRNNNFSYTKIFYKCFVCGESGDVIKLVQKLHGLTFPQAVVRINRDFNLGLSTRKPSMQERRMQRENEKVEKAIDKAISGKRTYYNILSECCRIVTETIASCEDPEQLEKLRAFQGELENWLDDNIEEVITEWK